MNKAYVITEILKAYSSRICQANRRLTTNRAAVLCIYVPCDSSHNTGCFHNSDANSYKIPQFTVRDSTLISYPFHIGSV